MTILEALSIAFNFTGQTMPDAALAEMAVELSQYPERDVMLALKRCRSELKSIKYSDILDRLPNGFPGQEEAWGICGGLLTDESRSVVWTEEMREAMGVAFALADDRIAARKAFQEKYKELVAVARSNKQRPKWSFSPGYDRNGREPVLLEAVKSGRLSHDYALKQLPVEAHESIYALIGESSAKRIA